MLVFSFSSGTLSGKSTVYACFRLSDSSLSRHCCRFLSDSKQKFSKASIISGSISSSKSYLWMQHKGFRGMDVTFKILKSKMCTLKYLAFQSIFRETHTQLWEREKERAGGEQEWVKPSFTPSCWLNWIWDCGQPCCIVGQSNTAAKLRGPQVSGGHMTSLGKLLSDHMTKVVQAWWHGWIHTKCGLNDTTVTWYED